MILLYKLIKYLYDTNPFKGKERILTFLLKTYKILHNTPEKIIMTASDGRRFNADLYDRIYSSLYFTGYYEKNETLYMERAIQKGDIVLDIGANFGWYTTLFSKLVGERGQVHVFEPVPWIFELLISNVQLNNLPDNINLNNVALGDREEEIGINVFKSLSHGHASISSLGRNDNEVFPAKMERLDDYLKKNLHDKNIRLIKMDVEGAEMLVIKGSENLLRNANNIKIIFEINFETSSAFGYAPVDLFMQLSEYGFGDFNKIIRGGKPQEIEDLNIIEHGDNIVCSK
jgi:FkbM family methyltransferase